MLDYDLGCFFVFVGSNAIKAHNKDMLIVGIITVAMLLVARVVNLSERFYQWSRVWEEYQADEIFFPLLALSMCLIWFSRRRYQEAKIESESNASLLTENRRLVRSLTESQEQERLFLAQELHDVFAQHLTALRTYGEIIQTLAKSDHLMFIQPAQKIIENVDSLQTVTRSLLKTLRPPLIGFGIAMAIEDLVTEWQFSHKQIQCQLNFHGEQADLNEEEILTLYRTTQEGLSNIARHSHASHVDIDLYFPLSHSPLPVITLRLCNDGVIDLANNKSVGLGLIGVRERAMTLNGQFNLDLSSPNKTTLELHFPLHQVSP